MSSQDPDEFDRIVEGLELDSPDELEFVELENTTAEPSELFDKVPDVQDLPEFTEVMYRQAPAVSASGNPFRQWGWLALAAVPVALIVFSLAGVYVSPALTGMIVVGSVGLLAYLLLTNPAEGGGSIYDDGSSV